MIEGPTGRGGGGIETAKGVETLVVPNDLGEEPQVSAAINAALNRLGRLDIVMSNAGVPGTDDTPIDVIDLES